MTTANVKQMAGETALINIKTHPRDERILYVTLHNRNITVELTNIGCAIIAIYMPDRKGNRKNVVAGYEDVLQYQGNKDYFGVIVGRYANRIAGGSFCLDGKQYQLSVNDGNNHLHGGVSGFSHKLWELASVKQNDRQCSVAFSYHSPDGEEGYPGALSVTVEYMLDDAGKLHIRYQATCTQSTPVNLTNHSYFNLTGFETPVVTAHRLTVYADTYTEKDANNTSSGGIGSVDNTALDFRQPRNIKEGIGNFPEDRGYDHNFILRHTKDIAVSKAAVLSEETTGRTVTVYTDRPAMQVYTGNYWDGTITGKQGHLYVQHGGIALETQAYPDSVHHPHFPDTILHPGEKYQTETIFEFGISNG